MGGKVILNMVTKTLIKQDDIDKN